MRSKYFLRGMGVGILVTVIIFAVSLVFYEPSLSEEEIIEKATALGMVQSEDSEKKDDETKNTEDSDSKTENETEESQEASSENDENATSDGSNNSQSNNSDIDSLSEDNSLETNGSEDAEISLNTQADASKNETDNSSSLVSFTVSSGESSYKICENLYQAGLIDNPGSFNQYLEDMGYDDTIRTGSYNIPMGSSYGEIANAISN